MNLDKLIVHFSEQAIVMHRTDIVELNRIRRHQNGACPTTIYMDSSIIREKKFILPMDEIVRLKPISQLERQIYNDPFRF